MVLLQNPLSGQVIDETPTDAFKLTEQDFATGTDTTDPAVEPGAELAVGHTIDASAAIV